jgi:hypothetical protein
VAKKPFNILSWGIFFVLVALSLALSASGLIGLSEVPSVVVALTGIWIVVLAGLQTGRQEKYGRSTFSTFSWGVLTSTLGLVWFLYIRQIFVNYLPVIFLLVFGILIIVAALRGWKK